MNNSPLSQQPFAVKDCALIAIATGKRAQNLGELLTLLRSIEADSIYYHFWGSLLRPRFDDPEYHNDFAYWSRHGIHDKVLAEQLGLIDPTDFSSLEELRAELIDIIEERLDDLGYPPTSKYDNQFEFIRSQIVVFDTHNEVTHPAELAEVLPATSVGSIFYHFIDARRRNEGGLDDYQNWMKGLGPEFSFLCDAIAGIDPFFSTLSELRREVSTAFEKFFETEGKRK